MAMRDRRNDSARRFLESWSLDMLAPLDDAAARRGGDLLGRWDDLAVRDLPREARSVALRPRVSWEDVAAHLAERRAIVRGIATFRNALRAELTSRHGERDASVTIARLGLEDERVPTLKELGEEWDLTRERVRQLVVPVEAASAAALPATAPLRLSLAAWFALNARRPLDVARLAPPDRADERALSLALRALGYHPTETAASVWCATSREQRAFDAIADVLADVVEGAESIEDIATRVAERLPRITDAVDLPYVVELYADVFDYGFGIGGRFVFGLSHLRRRAAQKIVTYLARRAAPVAPETLAEVIRHGLPPFEPFNRPLVDANWLVECVTSEPELLQIHDDGNIALADRLAHLRPSGVLGILHTIVVEHGEPMRMIDLCDRAATYGISRNQVGVNIHSGRAASLFMLDRGIVGLVGRDEGADASRYEAARPGRQPRIRAGHELGLDASGHLAADVVVRRSIREQGFGLPWPFSILLFSDSPSLYVDGVRRQIDRRANGDLDLPELDPASTVRLKLRSTPRGHRLDIDTAVHSPITPIGMTIGRATPRGLDGTIERPAWVNVVLDRATSARSVTELSACFPRELPTRRRLYAVHALIALGLVETRRSSVAVHRERKLPSGLARAFAIASADPRAYPALPRDEQAAVAWLVWAAWLTTNLGWSVVRPNDLTEDDVAWDEDDDRGTLATSPRETSLMRVAEAAHHAADLIRHPGEVEPLDATRTIVRRYLTALGYTSYYSVSELDGAPSTSRLLAVRAGKDSPPKALWLLRPLGQDVRRSDVDHARRAAREGGVSDFAVTNALDVVGRVGGSRVEVTLRSAAAVAEAFDDLIRYAADPVMFENADELA